jgi:steroid 5-alpha reductase family enzyme
VSATSIFFAWPGTASLYAVAVIAAAMLVLWAVSLRIGDVSIIDVFWGPAFLLIALTVALAADGDAGRRWLLVALTAVWSLRLAVYLAIRKLAEPGEDRRYTAMRRRRGDSFALWSLVMIFALQGLLALIVSLPIQVAGYRAGPLGWSIAPGLALFCVGLFFEAVGDAQLRRFKRDGANAGKVMDRGLWRYTRHPNYFGDFCVWWGIWLVVLPAGGTWWTLIGPVLMSVLLIRVSGKALLEQGLRKRRPEYADYIERTSGFFPRPPRGAGRH